MDCNSLKKATPSLFVLALAFGFDASVADLAHPARLSAKEAADSKLTFEVYKDAKGEHRWRLLASNGKTIGGSGQGYKQKESCTKMVDTIKAQAGGDKLKFDVYQDKAQQFRWRLKAANGKQIAESGQGYKAKADCDHAIDLIKQGAGNAQVREAK